MSKSLDECFELLKEIQTSGDIVATVQMGPRNNGRKENYCCMIVKYLEPNSKIESVWGETPQDAILKTVALFKEALVDLHNR